MTGSKMKNKLFFQLNWLSEYRTQLMGICAVGVILCHANLKLNGVVLPSVLRLFFSFGNQGVDIFLLLSGIGMYYSLQKKEPLKNWYGKRFRTIGISYALIMLPFYIWYVIEIKGNVFDFVSLFTTVGFWKENFGAWYVALLIPLYAVTPFVGRLIDKSKKRLTVTWLIVVGIIVVCIVGKNICDGWLDNVFTRFLRSPAYFLGYGYGKAVQEKKRISWLVFPASILVAFVLIKVPGSGGVGYNVLCIPFVMLLCVLIRVAKAKWMQNTMCWLGKHSLELYLTNSFIPYFLRSFSVWDASWNKGNYVYYMIVIISGVLLSQGVYYFSKKIQSRIEKKYR